MTVTYEIAPNNLQDGRYYLKVIRGQRIGLDTLIDEMTSQTSLNEADIRSVVNALQQRVNAHLLLGNQPTIDGLASFNISLRGSLPTATADLTSTDISVQINVNADTALQKAVAREAKLTRAAARRRVPVIRALFDGNSQQEGVYTAGNIARLMGDEMKFNNGISDEGVFFIGSDGAETAVSSYLNAGNREINFLIPAGLTGPQEIEIRTRYSGNELVNGRSRTPVTPTV